jgi:hypothetical protein
MIANPNTTDRVSSLVLNHTKIDRRDLLGSVKTIVESLCNFITR